MIESFVTLRMFGAFRFGQQPLQVAGHLDGVYHLVLGITRVDVAALNFDFRACSIEVLVLQFAFHAAVDRIGEVGAERCDVEEIDAAADLLVGGEADADFAVFHLGVGEQILRRGHDFGHARLVIGA